MFTLTAASAADRRRFVFSTDPDTGRGNLLCRRYDGGLGLISPAGRGPNPTEAM